MVDKVCLNWFVGANVLLIVHGLVAYLSSEFGVDFLDPELPILSFVGLQLSAGLIYVSSLPGILRLSDSKGVLVCILIYGLLFRLCYFPSFPILEDDYHRFLWEGAVTVQGINPFLYSVEDILALEGKDSLDEGEQRLHQLARASGETITHVNYPNLRSVYPPVAQALFSMSYVFKPWSLFSWRIILLFFEIGTCLLLLKYLRHLKRSSLWIAIYWWNPLVIKETINSGHFDAVVLTAILAAAYLAVRQKKIWSLVMLVFAVGLKLWPAILVPFLLRSMWPNYKKLVYGLAIVVGALLLLLFPILNAGLGETSGFVAYGKYWEMNDGIFMVFQWGIVGCSQWLGIGIEQGRSITRIFVALILLGVVALVIFQKRFKDTDLHTYFLLIITLFFFLSPTQFPWYFVPVVGLSVLKFQKPLIILSILLPIYYLRFFFEVQNQVIYYDYLIVWLPYLLPLYLLCREQHRRVRQRKSIS